ncbi:unnamed protein product [Schistosoma mansoni]|uniref:Smp_201190 n=1 Tax=Schistosoma mansoni TaxID=6183 RepID=UPI00022C83EA|nr:unnamed protein product [Schistosoma mansoni]|eukprot:XP_018644965.1 unnamed protein product [Schistosoma mansoni]
MYQFSYDRFLIFYYKLYCCFYSLYSYMSIKYTCVVIYFILNVNEILISNVMFIIEFFFSLIYVNK